MSLVCDCGLCIWPADVPAARQTTLEEAAAPVKKDEAEPAIYYPGREIAGYMPHRSDFTYVRNFLLILFHPFPHSDTLHLVTLSEVVDWPINLL